jgi:hypothetical protein
MIYDMMDGEQPLLFQEMIGAIIAVGPKLVSLFGHRRGPESCHHHHQYPHIEWQSLATIFLPPIRSTLRRVAYATAQSDETLLYQVALSTC